MYRKYEIDGYEFDDELSYLRYKNDSEDNAFVFPHNYGGVKIEEDNDPYYPEHRISEVRIPKRVRPKKKATRTFKKWNKKGYRVMRGEKAVGFKNGEPLFTEKQVYKIC